MPLSVLVRVRDLRLESGAEGVEGPLCPPIPSGHMGKALSGRAGLLQLCWGWGSVVWGVQGSLLMNSPRLCSPCNISVSRESWLRQKARKSGLPPSPTLKGASLCWVLVVFLPHGEDSLGVRLPCRPLLPGLWLPGGQTGEGQLPLWFNSQCWLCAFPLLAGVIPLPAPRTRGL